MGQPIRVLHAVVNMNRGGAETLIMNLYRHIDRSKIQFDFLTSKEGVFDKEIIEMGGKIHRIPYLTDVGHFKYYSKLKQFFKQYNEYQIVHSHMDKMSGLVLAAAKKGNVPIRISHSHSTKSEGSIVAKLYKSFIGLKIKAVANHFIACSKESSQWLFGKHKNVSFLRNGIDFEAFRYSPLVRQKLRNSWGLEESDFILMHVGRFHPTKNHPFIIDVFSKLTESRPNSYLILVGEGPLKSDMVKKVNEMGFQNRVKFLGIRGDVNQIMQACDGMIFPSLYEGLPVTLIEAQGASLPCVISDTITQEVDIGMGFIKSLSLREPLDIWVNEITTLKGIKHRGLEPINKNGYDIREGSLWLQDYYLYLLKSIEDQDILKNQVKEVG